MKHNRRNKGFTLIELIVVVAILGVMAALLVPNMLGFVEKAREGADRADIGTLNGVTRAYRAEDPSADPFINLTKTDEALMQFLVDQGFIGQVLIPRSNNAEFNWDFGQELWVLENTGEDGNVAKTIGDTVLQSVMDLLGSLSGKTTGEIQSFLLAGGNPNGSTGGSAYRTYILNNEFNGIWPSFPSEMQGSVVPDVSGLKVMPFITDSAKNDPIIYAGTDTVNWNKADLFYSNGSWYRHKNPYLLNKPNSYSYFKYFGMTGSDLTAEITSNPQLWELVK